MTSGGGGGQVADYPHLRAALGLVCLVDVHPQIVEVIEFRLGFDGGRAGLHVHALTGRTANPEGCQRDVRGQVDCCRHGVGSGRLQAVDRPLQVHEEVVAAVVPLDEYG